MSGVAVAVLNSGSRSIASFARADREYQDIEMSEMDGTLTDLHLATGGLAQLSDEDRRALTALSIRLTHY